MFSAARVSASWARSCSTQRAPRDQRVRHFAERRLDRLFVAGDLDALAHGGEIEIGGIRAASEDRQAHLRLEAPARVAGLEQIGQLRARLAGESREADGGKEGGARRTDVGVGGLQGMLGRADVRAALQQLRGQACGQLLREHLRTQLALTGTDAVR